MKLHAELPLANNARGIVGSINLSAGSFDSRRECAIEIRDEDLVARLHEVTQRGLAEFPSPRLTDAGFMVELEDYERAPQKTWASETTARSTGRFDTRGCTLDWAGRLPRFLFATFVTQSLGKVEGPRTSQLRLWLTRLSLRRTWHFYQLW